MNDWIDFDGATPLSEIEARIKAEDVESHLVREDLFDRYPNGKTMRRVYVQRGKGRTEPSRLSAQFR
jgi:hypothetical protein